METNNNIESKLFPLVEIPLNKGESLHIQRGSMVLHTPGVKLSTKLNGAGIFAAIGRSLTSGESLFVTRVESSQDNGMITIAPSLPGEVVKLNCHGDNQYHLNDRSFLALDGTCSYKMKSQKLGNALFGGTGGFFIMTTEGNGTLLAEAFGSIKRIDLNNEEITIDNNHIVAWSTSLDYDIHMENGFWQSIGTGEGLVNTFRGTGEIYVQSLNPITFAEIVYAGNTPS